MYTRFFFIFILCLASFFNVFSQQTSLEWVRGNGGTGVSIVTDVEGNIYSTGSFTDSIDIDPGTADSQIVSKGNSDFYIQKLDSFGDLIWAKQFGGVLDDRSILIVLDSMNNLYCLGYFRSIVDFDPDTSVFNLQASPANQNDLFLLKLDPNGNFIWSKQFPTGSISIDDLKISKTGDIIIAGSLFGWCDFDPDPNVVREVRSTGSSSDGFILSLDSSGSFKWIFTARSTISAKLTSIDFDNYGNIVSCGRFTGTVSMPSDTGIVSFSSSGLGLIRYQSTLLLTLNDTAQVKWVRSRSGTKGLGDDLVLTNDDKIYTFGFNTSNGFKTINRFDTIGNHISTKFIGKGELTSLSAVHKDSSGNMYVVGKFIGNVDFGPGSITQIRESFGYAPNQNSPRTDGFVLSLDTGGNYNWMQHIGDQYDDDMVDVFVNHGNIHIVGNYTGNPNFDISSGVRKLGDNGIGNYSFIAVLGNNPSSYSIDSHAACSSFLWINNKQYNSSNNEASKIYKNAAGSDSIVLLDLTIGYDTVVELSYSFCDSGFVNNQWVFSSVVITDSLVSFVGCDSIVRHNVSVNHTSFGVDSIVACDSFTWINEQTYFSSVRSIYDTLGSSVGCDSIVELFLKIKNRSESTDTHIACDSFTWVDGLSYYSNNSDAQFILENSDGCDSVIRLDLKINRSSFYNLSVNSCDSFIWSNGKTYYSSNTSDKLILKNSFGCDSTVSLNLTIDVIDTIIPSRDNNRIFANYPSATAYKWLDCENDFAELIGEVGPSFIASQNGVYSVEVTKNECKDTSICLELRNVGVPKSRERIPFTIYPNPSKGKVVLFREGNNQSVEITLRDLNGRLVYYAEESWVDTLTLDLDKLGFIGTYFLMLNSPTIKESTLLILN